MFSRKKTARENFVELLKKAEEWRKLVHPVSLRELAGRYEKRLDEMILDAETEEQLQYAGGLFIVELQPKDTFSIRVELYFQDERKEWVKMQAQSKSMTLQYLDEEACRELQKVKKVEFSIDEPEKAPRAESGVQDKIVPFPGRTE